MKRITTLAFAIFLCISINAFAASGFVFNPLFTFSQGSTSENDKYHTLSLEGIARLGYQISFNNTLGFSILADIGYAYNSRSKENLVSAFFGNKEYFGSIYETHNIIFGIMPTLNVKNFSIGIGGGFQIPIEHSHYLKTSENGKNVITQDIIESDFNPTPYIRGIIDYAVYVDTKTAINFGLVLSYDLKAEGTLPQAHREAFYIGFQTGVKFAPKID